MLRNNNIVCFIVVYVFVCFTTTTTNAQDPWIVLTNYSGIQCGTASSISLYRGPLSNITINSCDPVIGSVSSPYVPPYGQFTCGPSSSYVSFFSSPSCSVSASSPLPSDTFCASHSGSSYILACQEGRQDIPVVNQWGSTASCATIKYSDSLCSKNFLLSIEAVEDPSVNYTLRIGECTNNGMGSQNIICGSYFQILLLFNFTTYYKIWQFLPPPPNPSPVSPLFFFSLATSDSPNTNFNSLSLFNASATLSPIYSVNITGVKPGERILGFDIRPKNNVLYGVGDNNSLYTINPTSGAASLVGTFTGCSTRVIDYTEGWSVNYNPVQDFLLVNNNAGQSWRINVDTRTCVNEATRAYYRGPGRPGGGICGGHSAYTNNLPNLPPNANTTLYTISGFFIEMTPTPFACTQLSGSYEGFLGPFDIYTSTSFVNTPFLIRDRTLVTFSLVDGGNQVNIGELPSLPSGYVYASISVLPPTYSTTSVSPSVSP